MLDTTKECLQGKLLINTGPFRHQLRRMPQNGKRYRTEYIMQKNTVKSVTNGLIWTYAERILAQFITILVTIILARMIAPDDYGLIAIVNVFINIANAFVTSGFGNALIQKKDADEVDFATTFFFSLLFSTGLYAIIFLSSDALAQFYRMPDLKLVTRIMALRLPIAAINSIQHAYVSKQMAFKKFFFSTLGGTMISAMIGIGMAYAGAGIWALVAQYLTNVCIDTVVLCFTSGWHLKFCYSNQRMKSLFSYGWKIMFVGVMTTLYSNLRNLVIGKKYTSADLAYSEKGEQFPSAIAGNINSSITKVLFPVLADCQNDKNQLKRIVRRSIKVGAYVLFPVLFGLAMVSESFVRLLLTEEWIECVPFLQVMCIVYALQPLQTASLQCIKAVGKSGLYLWIDVLKKLIGIIVLLATVFMFDQVLIIIVGALFLEIISTLILVPVNRKLIDYTYLEQVMDVLPTLVLTAAMCVCVRIAGGWVQSSLCQLMVQILAGLCTYVGLSIMTKNENFSYVLSIAKNMLGSHKSGKLLS